MKSALAEMIIQKIGTSTSGNYGHAGRPGLIGGGGGDGSRRNNVSDSRSGNIRGGVYYRMSVYETAMHLKQNGIKKGDSWYGRKPSVYMCSSEEEALTYAQLMNPGKSCGVAEIHIPKGIKIFKDNIDVDFGAERSFRVEQDIPKEWIMKIKFYDKDSELIYERSKKFNDLYYPIILEYNLERKSLLDILTKGGSGSGNYDGPGRPRYNKRGLEVIDEKYLRKNPEEVKKIKKEISSWEGNRKSLGLFALDDMATDETGSARGMIIKDKKETVGIVIYENSSKGNYIHLAMVATKRKGYGKDLVKDIVEKAVKREMGVKLFSDIDAIDFYDAIGVKPKGELIKGSGRNYGFTYNEAKKWLALQKKMYEKVEPESGIFVNNRGLKKKEVNLFDIVYKVGTARSGNYGHTGRIGQVGGSSEGISGFSKDAKDITSEQAMKQANYQDIKARMKKNLSEIKQGESNQIEVKGEINSRAASDIEKNMKAELSLYGNYLAGDTMSTARDYIDDFREVINKGINDGSLKDIKAEDLNKLGIDNVNKLLHQEVESNRQAFTDHGIRHIVGDVLRQRQIMKEMNSDITAKEVLMGDFIMINHDIGYTVPLIREGGERGISMTKQHPLFSQKITEEQRDMWNKDKIFSADEYSKMTEVIKTHDSTKISNKDILSASSRLSDNLSLFSKEKLPSVFKYVSGGDTYLINMGIAAAKKDSVAFEKHKKDLYQKIDDANISTSLKRDLKSATKEIGYLTPKFTLGVLAGEINSIKKESGRINISIKYNSYDAKMQKLFDMGQKQTKKFLEDNGVTDFSKTKYDIGNMLSLEVKGYEEKKSLFDITYKHLQGQHDQSTHGRKGRVYKEVSHKEFISVRNKLSKDKKYYITQYTPQQMKQYKLKSFLAEDKKSGFAIDPAGELVNVFSLNDNGVKLVKDAVKKGAKRLDCFDGMLPKFYGKAGFKEYKREKNWTAGDPDIVYMKVKE